MFIFEEWEIGICSVKKSVRDVWGMLVVCRGIEGSIVVIFFLLEICD